MASPDSIPSDPRRRFMDRFLVLAGDRHEMTVTYGSFDTPSGAVSEAHALWQNADIVDEHIARLWRRAHTNLHDLGTRLGFIAFPAQVRGAVVADLQQAEESHRRLRLWINDDDFSVRDVPWEYIVLEDVKRSTLSLHPSCSIVRNCAPVGRGPDQWDPVVHLAPSERLRVLVVYADPEIPSLAPIAAEALVDRVALQFTRMSSRPEVTRLCAAGPHVKSDRVATRANLARELQATHPHVVFLVAHGDVDDAKDQGVVYLESEEPPAYDEVSASDLADLVITTDGPAVVLLDVCWSASRGASGAGLAVARALCRPGCAVLSMQFAWPAPYDPLFWNTLVSSLVAPSTLDDCVFEAREIVATNPHSPMWGYAVQFRHGTPAPRPPQFVHHFGWQRELEALREVVPLADRALLEKILSRAKDWLDIPTLVRELDPLYVWVAGEFDEEHIAVRTKPSWFTRLLGTPGGFEWSTPDSGPFWVTAWVSGEDDDLAFRQTNDRTLALMAEEASRWPRGVRIRWRVRDSEARGAHEKSIARGFFEMLEEPEATDVRDRFQHARASGNLGAVIDLLLRSQLFDELFSYVNSVLQQSPSARERFLCHRALARAAADMQTKLALAGFGHPEALWAAALARRHSEASFRAIGSDRVSGGHST